MNDYIFANPAAFLLFLLFIPMIIWYIIRNKEVHASIQVSSIRGFLQAPKTLRLHLRHFLFAFRLLTLSLLIVVVARPQSTDNWVNKTTEGIDIMITMDISGSMLAEDFKPNRLEVSKNTAIEFISGRSLDRIGLVVFAGESFTQCPLTTDHAVLINLMKQVESGVIEDGTAIGMGLATALSRLKDSKAISKVVILLTDGDNNRGDISPVTAAEIARSLGIRVYTIGVGTLGLAPYPVQTPFGVQYQNMEVKIDEKSLTEIAQMTGGTYYRADNKSKLQEIYETIDKLEKSKIEEKEYTSKKEEYWIFALWAGIFILVEVLLRYTLLKSLP